jgi:multimeric flavodoxin WrbA
MAQQAGGRIYLFGQLVAIFAAQHGMIWVGLDVLPGYNSSQGTPQDINRVGSYLGAMAQANADQGPDVAPPQADRETAALLGERVARATLAWRGL